MQQVVTVKEILHGALDAKLVRVRGWIQNKRTGGGIIFVLLRDGSGVIACTLRKGKVVEKTFQEFQFIRIKTRGDGQGEVKKDTPTSGGGEVRGNMGREGQHGL